MRKLILAALLSCVSAVTAQAQSISPSGTVSHVWLAGGNNFGFRVYLTNNGSDALSNCTYSFAYINIADDNYQAMAATLLSSYYGHKNMTLHANQESNGFCHIYEIEG